MSRRRGSFFAIVWPILGLGAALALAAVRGGEGSARLAGYALGLLPFSVLIAGTAGWLWNRSPTPGRAWPGAVVALIVAIVTALILATIRFRLGGATGAVALSALPSTAELLMVAAILPTLLSAGAAVARDRGARSDLAVLGRVAAATAVLVLLLGPALIASAALGRTGLLNPLAVAAIVLVFVDRFDRRQARGSAP